GRSLAAVQERLRPGHRAVAGRGVGAAAGVPGAGVRRPGRGRATMTGNSTAGNGTRGIGNGTAGTGNGTVNGTENTTLAGFTVALTADRRRQELASLLERRGARGVCVPAVRIVPREGDARLRAAPRACVDAPLDDAVVSTGIGFRSWLEAARTWDLAEPLLARLAGARLLTRGPKATGAVRAAGLAEDWTAPGETV